MRRSFVVAGVVAMLGTGAGAAVAASWPDRLDLPDGTRPEGIATGKGHDLFVGSIPTGAVYRFDARTGERDLVVPGATGRAAIGLKADQHDRLFVSGGPTGKAFVYDADGGDLLAEFQLTPSGQATFINDVVLTQDAAYFTDSRQPTIYAVDLDLSGFEAIPLQGFDFVGDGVNNLNGIVATPDGDTLLAVQSATGDLWRIDPATGAAQRVDLGGYSLTNGDGLLLVGSRTLYVVQNRLNKITEFRLSSDHTSGELVDTLTHDAFDVPTTIARFGSHLYAVNARFGTGDPNNAEYWVTRLRRRATPAAPAAARGSSAAAAGPTSSSRRRAA